MNPELLSKIHNIDCLDFMRSLPDKCIDLTLTDPPYGVDFEYDSINDTRDALASLVSSFMPDVLRISKRVLITCGNGNQWLYPESDWTLAWISSAGAGQNKWGFTCWQPILAYGKDSYRENGLGARPDIFRSNETTEKLGHPCAKPIELWKHILIRGSAKNTDIIFDPFMGSGTTAVAAKQLGRKWLGCEISAKYCAIAEERLRQDYLF